jgi:hypothetical protein
MIPAAVPRGVFGAAIEAVLETSVARVEAFLGPIDGLAVGWGTVDLERAALGLGSDRSTTPLPDDDLLGARCLSVRPIADDLPIVLLEPNTEGRLAASLARHGEGPIALYLLVPARTIDRFRVVAPASGVNLSRPSSGPFGRAVLVLDEAAWGPHVIVASAAARGTIAP